MNLSDSQNKDVLITVCVFGSSDKKLAAKQKKAIELFIKALFEHRSRIRIITGGYGGVMELFSKIAKAKVKSKKIYLEIIGIVYAGYEEEPNKHNDKTIACSSLGERVQTMIDMGDIFVAFDGSSGTFHEISHLLEEIKYSNPETRAIFSEQLLLHEQWRDKFSLPEKQLAYFDQNQAIISGLIQMALTKVAPTNHKPSYPPIANEDIETGIQNLAARVDNVISNKKTAVNPTNIIGLDIAYRLDSPKASTQPHGVNYSYGTSLYKKVLKDFFEKHNSLLNTKKEQKIFEELTNTLSAKSETLETPVGQPLQFAIEKEESTFYKWNHHLEENNLGKLSLWLNRKLMLYTTPINFSAFLVLDTPLPRTFIDKIFELIEAFLLRYMPLALQPYISQKIGQSIDLNKSGKYPVNLFVPKWSFEDSRSDKLDKVKAVEKNRFVDTDINWFMGPMKDVAQNLVNTIVTNNGVIVTIENDPLELSFPEAHVIKTPEQITKLVYGRFYILTLTLVLAQTIEAACAHLAPNKKTDKRWCNVTFGIAGFTKFHTQAALINEVVPKISVAEYDFLVHAVNYFNSGVPSQITTARKGDSPNPVSSIFPSYFPVKTASK